MKNKELFEKTIKIWVKAFLDGTLAKGNCSACAIGNLAAYNLGEVYIKNKFGLLETRIKDNPDLLGISTLWSHVLYSGSYGLRHSIEGQRAVESTGYTASELRWIERTFENNTEIEETSYSYTSEKKILEDQFNGLMACVDALMEIHECDDMSCKEIFKKALQTKIN